jgi:transposase
VTSTYFEGLCPINPQAQRGYSRDHRPDCKQVCIALVVTCDGMPLGYDVFAGNRTDVTTVEEIVETMEARFGLAQRIWVMDRGMTSAENLAWLRQTGRRYLIGTPKGELKKWAAALLDEKDWRQVREGLEVKLCPGPDGAETFVLCRSTDRREKEAAMHERFAKRIEAGLAALGRRLAKARTPLERWKLERQLGRLLERNSRAAGKYTVKLVKDPGRAAGLRLEWSANYEWDEWARLSEGCYLLRTNVAEFTPDELWKIYIQLTEAESAFRVHKSDLGLRPIWHHKPERVQAHIFVCFLAYALWKTLERWQERAGLGNSPRTILTELRRIQSNDVVLPLADEPGREARLRCVVRPDKAQAYLLDHLGLRLPERLRIPQVAQNVVPTSEAKYANLNNQDP